MLRDVAVKHCLSSRVELLDYLDSIDCSLEDFQAMLSGRQFSIDPDLLVDVIFNVYFKYFGNTLQKIFVWVVTVSNRLKTQQFFYFFPLKKESDKYLRICVSGSLL